MEDHFKFLPGEQRRFLVNIFLKSNLSIRDLAKIVQVNIRTYRDWLKEKFTITSSSAKILSHRFDIEFPEEQSALIQRWKESRKLASEIATLAFVKKYGCPGTIEGRKKGGERAFSVLRARGIIPDVKVFQTPKQSIELAEWVGITLGDGGISKHQVRISLNSISDIDYIPFVANLGKKLFGDKPKFFYRKEANCVDLIHNGTNLTKWLATIGLKQGNKVKIQVQVPEWIVENIEFSTACLRGLMDTDGGIFKHSYFIKDKKYSYYKLQFCNRSYPLINFVHFHLSRLGFNPKIFDKTKSKRVWLYSQEETRKYLEMVGTSNPRLRVNFKDHQEKSYTLI